MYNIYSECEQRNGKAIAAPSEYFNSRKERKTMKTFEVTCPHCGETFEVEVPAKVKVARGQLAGIAITDMTDEQLKREIINASSVLYKAKQRGASEETIAANQARLDAAKAEKASRQPVITTEEATEATDEVVDGDTDAETAEEI